MMRFLTWLFLFLMIAAAVYVGVEKPWNPVELKQTHLENHYQESMIPPIAQELEANLPELPKIREAVEQQPPKQPQVVRGSPSKEIGKSLFGQLLDHELKPKKKDSETERLDALDLPTLMKEKNLKMGTPVFIRAFKEERELEVFLEADDKTYKLLRTYPIVAASGVLGPKLAEGDMQVPEGFYFSSQKSMKPDSDFHLAFNIGYPNAYDRAHGRTGSFIMVHGSNVSIGCLAMTNEKIEEIYAICQAALDAGQPFFRVHIFPFRMTDQRMQKAANDPWIGFWKNLKTGYDIFENTRIPPDVSVKDKEYVFE